MKYLAARSNAYFHAFCDNPFYQPFECIQRKYLAFCTYGDKQKHNLFPYTAALGYAEKFPAFAISLLKRYIEVFKDLLESSSFRE